MLKHHVHRLASRLFLLCVLTIALLTTWNPVELKVKALVSCAECETRYNTCMFSCEPCSSAAMSRCQYRREACLLSCE